MEQKRKAQFELIATESVQHHRKLMCASEPCSEESLCGMVVSHNCDDCHFEKCRLCEESKVVSGKVVSVHAAEQASMFEVELGGGTDASSGSAQTTLIDAIELHRIAVVPREADNVCRTVAYADALSVACQPYALVGAVVQQYDGNGGWLVGKVSRFLPDGEQEASDDNRCNVALNNQDHASDNSEEDTFVPASYLAQGAPLSRERKGTPVYSEYIREQKQAWLARGKFQGGDALRVQRRSKKTQAVVPRWRLVWRAEDGKGGYESANPVELEALLANPTDRWTLRNTPQYVSFRKTK